MANSTQPTNPQRGENIFQLVWNSLLSLLSLLWNLATEGLKMLLNTLREIPPIIIGLVSGTLLCWFGLTLLTQNETIRIIFAVTLSLLALGALALAWFQKWLDFKKEMQREEWKRLKEKEERQWTAREPAPTAKSPLLREETEALEKLLELKKKAAFENAATASQLEDAASKTWLTLLEQITHSVEISLPDSSSTAKNVESNG